MPYHREKEAIAVNVPLKVVIYPQEDGPGFLAVCEELQGCHAEGQTIGEALDNVQDVARTLLALRQEDGLPIPQASASGSLQVVDVTLAVSVS
ncbi:MAG: type II toxin-antitoxin system HicB family antitoxin [Sulfobacillus sp.]